MFDCAFDKNIIIITAHKQEEEDSCGKHRRRCYRRAFTAEDSCCASERRSISERKRHNRAFLASTLFSCWLLLFVVEQSSVSLIVGVLAFGTLHLQTVQQLRSTSLTQISSATRQTNCIRPPGIRQKQHSALNMGMFFLTPCCLLILLLLFVTVAFSLRCVFFIDVVKLLILVFFLFLSRDFVN